MSVFGFINTQVEIPKGIKLPIDTLMSISYPNYIRVIENCSEKKITVCWPGNEKVIYCIKDSFESKHSQLFKRLIDEIAADSAENKIVFRSIRDLGNCLEESRALYIYMMKKRIKAEFLNNPEANTNRFLYVLENMPEAVMFAMADLFGDLYKKDCYFSQYGEYFDTEDTKYSQLDQNEKKEC